MYIGKDEIQTVNFPEANIVYTDSNGAKHAFSDIAEVVAWCLKRIEELEMAVAG